MHLWRAADRKRMPGVARGSPLSCGAVCEKGLPVLLVFAVSNWGFHQIPGLPQGLFLSVRYK